MNQVMRKNELLIHHRWLIFFGLLLWGAGMPLLALADDTDTPGPLIFAEPAPRGDAIETAVDLLGPRYQTELPQLKKVEIVPRPRAVLPDIFVKILMVLGVVVLFIVIMNLFYSRDGLGLDDDADLMNANGEIDFSRLQVGDPQQLAAAGRFNEAIHALLLRSLVLTAQRIDSSWPRSLTSREILRNRKLPEKARGHLGQLIHRVEVHHFGGLPPVQNDFTRCLEIYERLDSSLKGETT